MKTCGSCKWHMQEATTQGWECTNINSKRCYGFTMKYDTCHAWEGWTKEEINKGYDQVMGMFNSLKGKAAGK